MRVGITGHQHRDGIDWEWARSEIDAFFKKERPVQAFSCLAAGADQLFVEVALENNVPVVAIIPSIEYELEFTEDGKREAYHALLARCTSIVLDDQDGDREQGFLEAGYRVVHESDVVIAVWDGKPSAGLGGTGDVVRYTRCFPGKRLIHLDAIQKKMAELSPYEPEYDAFISYKQSVDDAFAVKLDKRLKRFARYPWQRSNSICRDKSEFETTAALWPDIRERLSKSRNLILLASPESASSVWVQKEVEFWIKRNLTPERILIVQTGGTIFLSDDKSGFDWDRTTSLPREVLADKYNFPPKWEDATELKTAVEWSKERAGWDGLIESLYAAMFDLKLADVRGEERKRRAVVGLIVLTAFLALMASTETILRQQRDRTRIEFHNIARTWFAQDDPVAAAAVVVEALEADSAVENDEMNWTLLNALHVSQESAILDADKTADEKHPGVRHLALSRDGEALVSARRNTVTFWNASRLELIATIRSGEITGIDLSPDAERVLTVSGDKMIRVWNWRTDTTTPGLSITLPAKPKLALFDADASRIATLDASGEVCVWPAVSAPATCPVPLKSERGKITYLAWRPKSNAIVGISSTGSVSIWDATTGASLPSPDPLPVSADFDWRFAIDAQGARIAAWVEKDDDNIKSKEQAGAIWTLDGTSPPILVPIEDKKYIGGTIFSDNGKLVIYRMTDRVQVRSAESDVILAQLSQHTSYVRDARFVAGGRRLITASHDRTIRIWDTTTWSTVRVLRGHENRMNQILVRADGCHAYSASDDGTVRVWTIAAGAWQRRLATGPCYSSDPQLSAARLNGASFSSDGTTLATASADKYVRTWDVGTGDARGIYPTAGQVDPTAQSALATAFSADGRWLAVGEGDFDDAKKKSYLRVYDRVSGKRLEPTKMGGRVRSLEFGRSSGKLLAAVGDGTAVVLEITTEGKLKEDYPLPDPDRVPITSAAWSADEQYIATSSVGDANRRIPGKVCIWITAKGTKQKPNCKALVGNVYDIDWSHRGRKLVAVDGAANVWTWPTENVSAGADRITLLDDEHAIDVSFLEDDRHVIARLNDGRLLVRNLDLARDVYVLKQNVVTTGFALSADGRWLATTHQDGAANLMPLARSRNDLLARARRGILRCLSETQRRRYGGAAKDPPKFCHGKWTPQRKGTLTYRIPPA